MNPMEFIRGIKNPQSFVMNMIGQNSNPMLNKLMQMAKNGNSEGIENFARNFCKERRSKF